MFTIPYHLLPSAAPTVAVGNNTVMPKSSVRRQTGEALPYTPEYTAVLVKAVDSISSCLGRYSPRTCRMMSVFQ